MTECALAFSFRNVAFWMTTALDSTDVEDSVVILIKELKLLELLTLCCSYLNVGSKLRLYSFSSH